MIEWLELTKNRQIEILNLVSAKTGLPAYSIEKDWWVTLALKAAFSSEWTKYLVFKGGTSLSKSWGLIDRFSEDIDLVLDREVLGFSGDLSRNKIKELRKASCKFTSDPFREAIGQALVSMGVDKELFSLSAQATQDSDRDPQVLELNYKSVLVKGNYIQEAVLMEVGARSLREPSRQREIVSIISEELPDQPFSGSAFSVETVDPARTFLEKAFLLHEEFCKPADKVRIERMSRHLYDLDRLMDTEHGILALGDTDVYRSIIEHREKFNLIKGIDYSGHHPTRISFVPPDDLMQDWEQDYKAMQNSMIYGESRDFATLIGRIIELRDRFRKIKLE
ncbi:nucleotidyl transferase AbiEii/AbiGii toxin family protein [Daejeonella sp.]|uniref:nucleotidyl transferase AbiEii/AbiGii toxin family protein n=1 Tax=Daejeonella sp. TaxID=2805397 RepID=UPI0030C5A558